MRVGLNSKDAGSDTIRGVFQNLADFGCEVTQMKFAPAWQEDLGITRQIEIPSNYRKETIRSIKSAAEDNGIDIVVINGTFNMAHPDKAVRDDAVARYPYFLEAVNELGCRIVSLSTGTRSTVSTWSYTPETALPDAWNDMIETMERLLPLAEAADVTLALETEASNVVDTPQKARRLLEQIRSPRLKMIMDCANLFRRGEAHRENVRARMDEAFDCFGKDVIVAHGKDILEGDGIEFCAAGEGIVDYDYFVQKLREYHFEGDMLMHGIHEPEKIRAAIAMLRQIAARY